MAGYSGTPLPKKLGIKEQYRVAFIDMPADIKSELKEALAACKIAAKGPLDYVHLFVKSQADLEKTLVRFRPQLAPAGMIWVSWPKKSSGVETDVTENDVRRVGLAVGVVDVKVCAVNEIWSGLKFVIRVKDR
ncbi:MAG TPA: DUF3052 family protein [Terriglobales bacterium]|nr:DUF3052 family protein [Terriglobales bacterium]